MRRKDHEFLNESMKIQWNLVINFNGVGYVTKPSYNKVILLVPALYIYYFYPDVTKPDATR